MTDENAEIDEYVKRYGGKVNAEEESPGLGAEAPQRDGAVPPLQAHPVGFRAMAGPRREGLQGPRSLLDDAFEAGEREGYAQGYVDGHDDGRESVMCMLRAFLKRVEGGELE